MCVCGAGGGEVWGVLLKVHVSFWEAFCWETKCGKIG